MKKNVLKYIFVLAASCAYAAPIPSYRVATNIAETVALDVVSNTVTKTYVESLGIGVEPGDYAVVSNAAVSAAITNALQDVAITTLGSYVDSATNDVLVAAQGYTDEKISEIETPDFSTNNVELVETIETMAPMPGDYAAVSNAAVYAAITNAMQDASLAGKQDALSQEQLANIAAVSNKANDADVVHRNGNETMEGNLTINNANPRLLLTNGANDLGMRITNGKKYIETEDYDYQLPHGDGTLVISDGTGRKGYFASFGSFGKLTDSGVSTNLYLKKTGDTMTGPLDMGSYSIHQMTPFGKEFWLYPGKFYMTGGYELDIPIKNGVVATVEDIDLSTNGLWVATTNAIENAVNDIHLFAQYYPEGNVKSAAEFTSGIKYDAPDTTNRTITVKAFCHTNTTNDNSSLVGRVVIPPFVDAQGNPYVSDDGTRFRVVVVSGGSPNNDNTNLTAIVAPNTVMTIGSYAFSYCTSLSSASLPAATAVENSAFRDCTSLSSVYLPSAMSIGSFAFRKCSSLTTITSLHSATNIGSSAFRSCTALKSVSLPSVTTIEFSAFESCSTLSTVYIPAATSIKSDAFNSCSALTSIDFGDTPLQSVPYLAPGAFVFVTATTCKIIVPDAQYDEWIAADWWSELVMDGFQFLRHSEWEYARKYEVNKKADKPTTFTTGNLAKFDANGNPIDSGMSRDGNGNLDATEFTFTPTQVADYDSAAVGTVINKATTPVVLHGGQHYVVRKSFYKTNGGWVVDSVAGKVVLPGASGIGSTALGDATQATGNGAVSTGKNTKASGAGALSSGQETDAVGTGAHAEGQATSATATCAHSEGYFTIAQNQSEHAQGEYNASHTGVTASEKTLNSIGIGNSIERKNAVEVMRDGKVFVLGLGGYVGTNPTDSTNLATVVGGKANDNAVVHLAGDETVGGVKTFGSEGVVVRDTQTGLSMKLLGAGIAVTDGSDTAYFYVPNITGGGGTFALLSDVMSKADRVANPTAGNLAMLDEYGNPTDSGKKPSDFLERATIPPIYKNQTVDVSDPAKLAEVVSNVVQLVFGGTAVSGSGGQ